MHAGADGLKIDVDQAYGNCPKYIQQRGIGVASPASSVRRHSLGPRDSALIAEAVTFFLGTVHPDRGADASHRGGTPGFVRVDGLQLWWPDYHPEAVVTSEVGLLAQPPVTSPHNPPLG